jgi:hypothetical protein
MIVFQILIVAAIIVSIMYGIALHEDRLEQEERRAANREHTLDLFIRNRL